MVPPGDANSAHPKENSTPPPSGNPSPSHIDLGAELSERHLTRFGIARLALEVTGNGSVWFDQATLFPVDAVEGIYNPETFGRCEQNRVSVNQGNIAGQDIGPSPGFAVVSLNGSRRLGKYAHVSAGMDNLLDKPFAEHISRAGGMISGFIRTARINEPGLSGRN